MAGEVVWDLSEEKTGQIKLKKNPHSGSYNSEEAKPTNRTIIEKT